MMRYELTDYEWAAIRPMFAEQGARRASGGRSTRVGASQGKGAGCAAYDTKERAGS